MEATLRRLRNGIRSIVLPILFPLVPYAAGSIPDPGNPYRSRICTCFVGIYTDLDLLALSTRDIYSIRPVYLIPDKDSAPEGVVMI